MKIAISCSVFCHFFLVMLLINDEPNTHMTEATKFDVIFMAHQAEENHDVVESCEACSPDPVKPLAEANQRNLKPKSIPHPKAKFFNASTKRASHHGLDNPLPRYPLIARKRKHEGIVTILVNVSPQGTCKKLKVTKSSGHYELDRAAMTALQKWRFYPTTFKGIKGEDELTLCFSFQLSTACVLL